MVLNPRSLRGRSAHYKWKKYADHGGQQQQFQNRFSGDNREPQKILCLERQAKFRSRRSLAIAGGDFSALDVLI